MSAAADTITGLLVDHNSKAAVSKLPVELLAEAFGFVPLKQRMPLCLVCRHWRTILLASPEVWDNIVFDPDHYASENALEAILRRSAESPLHLSLIIDSRTCQTSSRLLATNIHRCRSLYVTARGGGMPNTATNQITMALCTPAPILRRFCLFDPTGLFNSHRNPDFKLFDDKAPMLFLVKIHCEITTLTWSSGALRDVQRAMFCPITPFENRDTQILMRLFAGVKDLAVEILDWETSSEEETAISSVDLPGSLRSLLVIASRLDSQPERFLRTLRRASYVPSVWISYNEKAIADDGTILNVLAPAQTGYPSDQPRFIPRAMSFATSPFSEKALNIYMYDRDEDLHQLVQPAQRLPKSQLGDPGTERVLLDVGRSAQFAPSAFSNVCRLYLTEMAFDADVVGCPVPPMPSLVHLTINPLKAHLHSERRMFGAFIAASIGCGDPQRSLACPGLKTLRIAVQVLDTAEEPRTRLTADMIVAFVRAHLRYDDAVLERLFITGVETVVTNPAAFQELLNIAEEITFDLRHVIWGLRSQDGMFYWD